MCWNGFYLNYQTPTPGHHPSNCYKFKTHRADLRTSESPMKPKDAQNPVGNVLLL